MTAFNMKWGSPSLPDFAAAFGIPANPFLFDDFDSLNLVETDRATEPGKVWYQSAFASWMGSAGVHQASNPAWFSVADSVMTISTNNTNGQGGQLTLHGSTDGENWVSSIPRIDGSKPFYLEGRMKFENTSLSNSGFCPDFWIEDRDGIGKLARNLSSDGSSWAEIDVFEVFGGSSMKATVHNWTGNSQPNGGNVSAAAINSAHLGADVWQTWSVMVVPRAYNGGTGLVRFYADRAETRTALTYNDASPFKSIETSKFTIFMAAGKSTNGTALPLAIDYVACWGTPAL